MPGDSVDPWTDALIVDMREHDGAVTAGPLAGHPLLIMTSSGAKSDQPRRAILTYTRDGGDYIVAGTAGGAPTDPAWVHNVQAHPIVSIEVGNRTLPARATIVEETQRDRLWEAHVAALPWFANYPEQAGRVIPIVRLTPDAA